MLGRSSYSFVGIIQRSLLREVIITQVFPRITVQCLIPEQSQRISSAGLWTREPGVLGIFHIVSGWFMIWELERVPWGQYSSNCPFLLPSHFICRNFILNSHIASPGIQNVEVLLLGHAVTCASYHHRITYSGISLAYRQFASKQRPLFINILIQKVICRQRNHRHLVKTNMTAGQLTLLNPFHFLYVNMTVCLGVGDNRSHISIFIRVLI